jgi:hypothetical protein
MSHNTQFLPLDIRTSIAELRALHVPEAAIDLLSFRILKALEAKTTSLQMDIARIEESINTRLGRNEASLIADLRDRHHETTTMIRSLQTEFDRRGPLIDQILAQIAAINDEIATIEHEVIQDELQRDERIRLTVGLRGVLARWDEVTALLDIKAARDA